MSRSPFTCPVLRTVRRSEDYTHALILARSVMEGAYATTDPADASDTFDSGHFHATREVALVSDEEGVMVYDIKVRVTWPPRGSLRLEGRRILHEKEK